MKEKQKFINAFNYSDKIRIVKQHKKNFPFEKNTNFGTEFENSIITKSCVNLKIKSINDKSIFSKQYRHFAGLKILLIYNNQEYYKTIEYIKNLLDKGNYRVIPASSYSYTISFYRQKINISFDGAKLEVKDFYGNHLKKKKHAEPPKAQEKSKTSKNDIYLGTFYFFNDYGRRLELIIYSSEVEVDGFFEIFEDIQLDSFGADKIYLNFEENYMSSNSLLLYEIKSGDQLAKLKEQMSERCHFICNYLKVFYDRPIYYIGFYKDKKLKEIEINSDKGQNLNVNNIEEAKEINMKDNNGINGQSHSSEENTIAEKRNKANSDINEEDTSETINIEKNNAKIKLKEVNEITNENNNNIYTNKTKDMNFSSLKNLPARIAIFKLKDKIFDEKLIYEKEELNLLGTLRNDSNIVKNEIATIKSTVNDMKKNIDITDKKVDSIVNKVESIDKKVDERMNKMDKRMDSFETLLKAMAEKLGIDSNKILNEKKI